MTMNYRLLFSTIRHLKIKQLLYQVWNRLSKTKYEHLISYATVCPAFTCKPVNKARVSTGHEFFFLNVSSYFTSWSERSHGNSWADNLNYMDWLCQEGISFEEGSSWIDMFIKDLPTNPVGLDPYPIALRGINWIKFIIANCDKIDQDRKKRWDETLYSQYKLLEKKLEWHLLGNHLLEDIYSLFLASIYFNDTKMFLRYSRLLRRELNEQILPDGAHFEQSPMYHCILLDRILDCCNISCANIVFEGQEALNSFLKDKASLMLGHLESIVYENGDIPMLNDSAEGIAPAAHELFDYARRMGIGWTKQYLRECGYRKWTKAGYEVVLDVGNITATYQPGHSHADTFNYELRVDGQPFIVDTGISTYEKNSRRQFERSTVAHNCVSPDGADSSDVWGGFRVGRRCNSQIIYESENSVVACHDGFDKPCKRKLELSEDGLVVEDWYEGDAVSYIHIAENADEQRIHIDGATEVLVKEHMYSTEYNRFHKGIVFQVHFNGYLKYTIR